MERVRLQKWLSQLGITSRREAEKWIEAGRLTVNGKTAQLGDSCVPASDKIALDGKALPSTPPSKEYWMLCKPPGVLTTRRDPEGRRTIYQIPGVHSSWKPVGRLDFHTEGLLLLSNDGEWVHRLMHPSYHVVRKYYAMTPGRLSPVQEARLRGGLDLEDGPVHNLSVEYIPKKSDGMGAWYRIEVGEGRNRLVRRLFEAVNSRVVRLIRYAYGEVTLPEDLEPGRSRPLTVAQKAWLFKAVDLDPNPL